MDEGGTKILRQEKHGIARELKQHDVYLLPFQLGLAKVCAMLFFPKCLTPSPLLLPFQLGKSLCYAILPEVFDTLSTDNLIVVVITTLTALINDHVWLVALVYKKAWHGT